MAETRRVSSASPTVRRASARPRLPHPPRLAPSPRRLVDDTDDLRPPGPREDVEILPQPPREPAPPPAVVELPRIVAARPPRRTRTERMVLAMLVLGLVLNAIVLLRHAALSRADVLLGATVLCAGLALLVLMEVYRRTGQ
ncbi:MAG TPA: hypothetical protein VIE43_10410 [Thermoanaerobaculia bacterium]|jgi:hypothetical protein|nr:hypothetical protein [Thermoanaerobaculia bacterium]